MSVTTFLPIVEMTTEVSTVVFDHERLGSQTPVLFHYLPLNKMYPMDFKNDESSTSQGSLLN